MMLAPLCSPLSPRLRRLATRYFAQGRGHRSYCVGQTACLTPANSCPIFRTWRGRSGPGQTGLEARSKMNTTNIMSPEELAKAGCALYGERWQTSLAQELKVADRTMRRWLAGESPIPSGVESELREVLIR